MSGSALDGEQYCWGVDLGLRVVTFCAVRQDRPPAWLQAAGVEHGSIAERLSLLGGEVRWAAHSLAERHPPACVMVEQPIAHGRTNKHLIWGCGVVTVALHEALAGHAEHPVPIWHCGVQEWKKTVVGKGNATKPDVLDRVAELTGRNDLTQDEADAWGIGQHTLERLEPVS